MPRYPGCCLHSNFHTEILYPLPFPPSILNFLPISFCLTSYFSLQFENSKIYESLLCANFSRILLFVKPWFKHSPKYKNSARCNSSIIRIPLIFNEILIRCCRLQISEVYHISCKYYKCNLDFIILP